MVNQPERPDAASRHGSVQSDGNRARRCPWCGSDDVRLVQRGFTGPTDERDQYISCNRCDRVTYEIISRSARDMRLGQYRTGGTYRDSRRQTRYDITRVLKAGSNEYLLYVKPIIRSENSTPSGPSRRGRF
ncbi:MAG TPA: hypothetical protein VGR22_11665 [Thermomicrobiales bacterium]|nr:hypothetical protein [Thermomicrobiales bacterium]